jgi:hypothetical protein
MGSMRRSSPAGAGPGEAIDGVGEAKGRSRAMGAKTGGGGAAGREKKEETWK